MQISVTGGRDLERFEADRHYIYGSPIKVFPKTRATYYHYLVMKQDILIRTKKRKAATLVQENRLEEAQALCEQVLRTNRTRSAAALSKHLALPCAKCLQSRGAFLAPTALRSSKKRWPTIMGWTPPSL